MILEDLHGVVIWHCTNCIHHWVLRGDTGNLMSIGYIDHK